jgi:hypothetical protein
METKMQTIKSNQVWQNKRTKKLATVVYYIGGAVEYVTKGNFECDSATRFLEKYEIFRDS